MSEHATSLWEHRLASLEAGGYEPAVEELATDTPTADPAHRLWRALVLAYLGESDRAREEIDAARFGPAHRDRAELLLGEIALTEGRHEEARETGETVALRARDVASRVRAKALVARAAIRAGAYETGLATLAEPLEDARALGLDYLAGILMHCRCYCNVRLGRTTEAGRSFARALSYLERTGNRRWEGMCRSLYALFLQDIHLTDQARAEHGRALEIARELGLLPDEMFAANNYAQLLLSEGQIERALELLVPLVDVTRSTMHGVCEALVHISITIAHALEGRRDETGAAARRAFEVASEIEATDQMMGARVFLAWALWRADELRLLVAEADAGGLDQYRFLARCLLASDLVVNAPAEAARLLEQAAGLPDADGGDALSAFLPLARRRLEQAPIRIEGERLTIDLARGWPDYRLTLRTVGRWLLSRAIDEAEGVKAAAGRLVGLKRYSVCDEWNQLHGLPTRRPKPGGRARGSGQDDPDRLDDEPESGEGED